jgi:flavin-dependent dehydrogenase
MTSSSPVYDVIVVGARCAGAATARLLASAGLDVLVLDRVALPSDTLSTHGLARGGVVQLARWGLLEKVLESGAPAVREVTFHLGGTSLTKTVKERAGVDLLVAPRRFVLDDLLLTAAREAGAEVRLGAAVTGVAREDGRVVGVVARVRGGVDRVFRARHVVGADGMRSTMASLVGARRVASFAADVSLYYAYVGHTDWRGFEFHLAPESFAGAFPTHGGEACVWLSRPTQHLEPVRRAGGGRTEAWAAMLQAVAPELGRRVRSGHLGSPVRGCLAPPNHVRQAFGPGWSLVGDAGYHRDPITGHGITDAFRDAELLAEAIIAASRGRVPETEALRDYQEQRDRSLADTFAITEALCRFPSPTRFAELQIQLGEVLEREATQLASRPAPAGLRAAVAA